jgi:hypothetical protein
MAASDTLRANCTASHPWRPAPVQTPHLFTPANETLQAAHLSLKVATELLAFTQV